MFKSKRKRKYWSNNYKPTWISFMSFCFLSRMLSRSCCSSSVRSVITNIQEELEVIAWFHWPGGIRAYNIQPPTDSTPTSNPLTNNDQHMYPTRAKHKLDVFLPPFLIRVLMKSATQFLVGDACLIKIANPLYMVS